MSLFMNPTDGTTFQVNGDRVKPFLEHEPIHHVDVELIGPTSDWLRCTKSREDVKLHPTGR